MEDSENISRRTKIRIATDFVHVWHQRAAQNEAELREVISTLERALRRSRRRKILFDSRDSDVTPPDIQSLFWEWLEGAKLQKIATLVTSKNLAVSVRMTGVSRGVNLRAFDSESAATRWLSQD